VDRAGLRFAERYSYFDRSPRPRATARAIAITQGAMKRSQRLLAEIDAMSLVVGPASQRSFDADGRAAPH